MGSLSLKQVEAVEQVNFNHIFGYEWSERRFHLTFYFDSRTRFDGYIPIVKPIGKENDIYYICCPHCGRFETASEAEIIKGNMIMSKCSKGGFKPSRIIVKHSKRSNGVHIEKVKQFGYLIDLEGWGE
ncbi:MAG: hypothetical protein FNP40_13985 [Dehalobacter sp. 4CP]|uniref:hypothetical protein n=1 Tax=Dehalobacter sp. CP TaxID=2594474 RepID=UPI0013C7EB84|nr:hypothetical protein [Dehalobacter sp. 4CP]